MCFIDVWHGPEVGCFRGGVGRPIHRISVRVLAADALSARRAAARFGVSVSYVVKARGLVDLSQGCPTGLSRLGRVHGEPQAAGRQPRSLRCGAGLVRRTKATHCCRGSSAVGAPPHVPSRSALPIAMWKVVRSALVTCDDDDEKLVRQNESIYLPLGCVHRLENPGRIALTPTRCSRVPNSAGITSLRSYDDTTAGPSLDGAEHLAGRGEPAGRLLGVAHAAVHGDLEHTAARSP